MFSTMQSHLKKRRRRRKRAYLDLRAPPRPPTRQAFQSVPKRSKTFQSVPRRTIRPHHAIRNTQYAIRNTQYAPRTTHHATRSRHTSPAEPWRARLVLQRNADVRTSLGIGSLGIGLPAILSAVSSAVSSAVASGEGGSPWRRRVIPRSLPAHFSG